MFNSIFKNYTPANLVFAVYFQEGVDHKKVQQDINLYLSQYSQYRLTGIRDLNEDTGSLSWNLTGTKTVPATSRLRVFPLCVVRL